MTNIKTYSEVVLLPTFLERFEYLKIGGIVGKATFGYDRYLNQILYCSPEWKKFRQEIIFRDNGCDLAFEGHDIYERILVHHINPISVNDILDRNPMVFDPENVICTMHNTHNAIHYGDEDLLPKGLIERSRNDTCPWRK